MASMFGLSLRNLAVLLLLWAVAIPGCGKKAGPKKYSVQGVVRINGQPAERVAVLLHHVNGSLGGNLRYPTAVTDREGRFSLSTDGDKDGAVEGEYVATFTWLSSADIDAYDMLGGTLADPKKSQHRVHVQSGQEPVAAFDLRIPKEVIRLPRQRR